MSIVTEELVTKDLSALTHCISTPHLNSPLYACPLGVRSGMTSKVNTAVLHDVPFTRSAKGLLSGPRRSVDVAIDSS
jgi:hypothetical protein